MSNKVNNTDCLPYFKFFTDAYLSGSIQAAPMEEQGIFMNLIARSWKNGGYVEIDESTARLMRISYEDLSNAVAFLSSIAVLDFSDNKVSSKFVLLQLSEHRVLHRKRVKAGRKGGNTKQLNRASNARAELEPSCSILDIDIDIDKKTKGEKKKGARERFSKPSKTEVAEYAKTLGFDLDGSQFLDHYESKGWLVGKTPMKDWKACVRTWKRFRDEKNPEQAPLKVGQRTADGYMVMGATS